jgi:hypothetical protein
VRLQQNRAVEAEQLARKGLILCTVELANKPLYGV